MRRSLPCAVAVACLLSNPVAGARTEPLSWGKAGVSIDQYRTDAISCGRLGYYMDVSNTEAAHVFKDATGALESNEADLQSQAEMPLAGNPMDDPRYLYRVMGIVSRSARIVENTRPAERMKDVGNLMQAKVDDCLRERGYTRFKLTTGQRKHLGQLHLGSVERHVYLYQLGTNPDVLRAQAF
jgi:hypothetical protein